MEIELLAHTEVYRVNFNDVDYIVEESTDCTMENFDDNYSFNIGREDGKPIPKEEYINFMDEWKEK